MARTKDKSDTGGAPSPETETQTFLESLPELDAPLAARRLRDWLENLPRSHADPAALYAALNTIDSRVAAVATTLGGRHVTLSLPLSGRILEELEAIRQLHLAHARAWLHVVHSLPDKGAKPLARRDRELQAQARLRALRALTDVLLSSYRYYRDIPKGVWRDIHQAYWRGVYADAVGKPRYPEEKEAQAEYTRALLLGLCGAGQLPYRAIDQVALALARDWKPEALIKGQSVIGDSDSPRGRFLIDAASDRPATPVLSGVRARPTDQILVTAPLITQLRERFEHLVRSLSGDADTGRLPPDFGELEMLRTLIGKWSGGALRRQKRTPARTPGKVVGGLSRIYQTFSTAGNETEAEIVLSTAETLLNPFRQITHSSLPPQPQWMEISLEDQSDEGLCIRVPRQTGAYLAVGDLICTRHAERAAGAEIGVIARARALGADEVEFGIRKLGVARDTARIYLVGKDASPGDTENLGMPFRALVLDRTKTRPEMIVADKGLYRPGATLWATWSSEVHIVRADALFLSTRNFDAFTYATAVSAAHVGGLFAKPIKRSSGTGGDQETVI